MSVRLVLCVVDSVWRAAGRLARVCMPTAHTRIAGAAGAVCRRLRLACGLHVHGALASRLLRCCC